VTVVVLAVILLSGNVLIATLIGMILASGLAFWVFVLFIGRDTLEDRFDLARAYLRRRPKS
jgi:hypothetical protein